MSLSYLKSNRTCYKKLLERELALGKNLIKEEKEEIDLKYLCTKVSNLGPLTLESNMLTTAKIQGCERNISVKLF